MSIRQNLKTNGLEYCGSYTTLKTLESQNGWGRVGEKEGGSSGCFDNDKERTWGWGHGRGFISTAFCQEPVLMLKKFMALHSFIAPVCNYLLLWLSLFTRDTSESEAHLLILIRFMTEADRSSVFFSVK